MKKIIIVLALFLFLSPIVASAHFGDMMGLNNLF